MLAAGAVDVTVSWGEAVAYDMSADRKDDRARRGTIGPAHDRRGAARRAAYGEDRRTPLGERNRYCEPM